MGVGIAAGAIGGAVLSGAGKIIGGFMQKAAAKRAAAAMENALKQLKSIDIGATINLADERDIARFRTGLETQKFYDPTLGAVRDTAASNILKGLQDDPKANALLGALQDESLKDTPQRAAIIDQLFAGAKQELDAGATLPPSLQGEIVKAGLQQGGQAGVGADYRGTAGAQARVLLGQAGLNLQAFRQQQAGQAMTMADQLKQQRAAILGNATTTTENVAGQRQARNVNAFNVAQASVPAIGLTGHDVVGESVANTNLQNWIEMQKGGITAGLATQMGALNAGIANAAGDTAGSIFKGLVGGGPTTPTTGAPAAGADGGVAGSSAPGAAYGAGYQFSLPSTYAPATYAPTQAVSPYYYQPTTVSPASNSGITYNGFRLY